MRNMRAKWILLSAMLFSACAAQPAEEAVPSGSPQPYVMEAGGYICEVIAEDYYDSSTSQRGYTVVNQTDETIQYQIAAGEKSSGGYDLEVDSMKEDNGILIVTVWETRPDDDDMVTDALTYPSMIVSISPRPEYVVFQDQDGTVFELLRPEEK